MVAAMDRFIKRSIGRIPTRSLLAFFFSLLLLTAIVLTSLLLINSGNKIVGDVIEDTAKTISKDLSREVSRFLNTPDTVNGNGARSILAGRIDYKNNDSITRFFMDSPQRRTEYSVSSIYFAEPSGRFIGVEISGLYPGQDLWDVSISSQDTNGIYTDFQVNTNGTVGSKIGEVKPYDPRVRDWYINALATPDRPVWTEVYTDFNTNLATLTRAQAVLDERGDVIGVLAVDMFLERIQMFLSTLEMSTNSEAFIINDDGLVLAAYTPAYTGELPSHNLLVKDSPFKYMPSAVNMIGDLNKVNDNNTENYTFKRGPDHATTVNLLEQEGYLYATSIGEEHGVNWTLGVYIPNSDFLQSSNEHLVKLAPLAAIGLLLIGTALQLFLSVVIRPLEELRENAMKIASGNFNTPIDTSMTNEVGEFAKSINSMQQSLQSSFTEINNNYEELSKEKCRIETTLRSIADGVISVDKNNKVLYMNPTAESLVGWELAHVQFKDAAHILKVQYTDKEKHLNLDKFEEILHSTTSTEIQGLELVNQSSDKCPISFCIAPTISEDGEYHGSVIVLSDLTEKIQLTTELVHQATHDDLTGLINRREFERQLGNLLSKDRKVHDTDTLLYLDLDQFKIVNDTCGHIAGDELLRQVSSVFEQCVRVGDVVARLGGDEFGVLLKHCKSEDGTRIAQKILAALGKFRFDWEQRSFRLGVSIGLLSIDPHVLSVGTALSDADNACYLAKEKGRNRIHQFHEKNDSVNTRRNETRWVDRIDQAIEHDEFVLYTQRIVPAIKHPDDRIHFEVLIRMLGDNGEIIPPGTFLPAAERYNLASSIDRWVVKNTFKWLNDNRDFTSTMGICSINMSGQSISDKKIADYIINLLDSYQIPADQICFEVTETTTIANLSSAVDIIETLRKRGCLFALDDFGTGLSSFEYLKNLHVDYLKIDGVFVRDIIDNEYDLAIVNSINGIGQTLGLKTVAEFVENQELVDKLTEIGLDYLQGIGISPPQPIDNLLATPIKKVA